MGDFIRHLYVCDSTYFFALLVVMGKGEEKKLADGSKNASDGNTSNDTSIESVSSAKSSNKSLCSCGAFSVFIILIGVSALVAAVVIEAVKIDKENKSLNKEIKVMKQKMEETDKQIVTTLRKEAAAAKQVETFGNYNIELTTKNNELKKEEKETQKRIKETEKIVARLETENNNL